MDLVVTVSNDKVDDFLQELQEIDIFNLTKKIKVLHIPELLTFGDHIYFLLGREISYKGKYINVINSPYSQQSQDKNVDGMCLEIEELKEINSVNRIQMDGFRGYRYKWWEESHV